MSDAANPFWSARLESSGPITFTTVDWSQPSRVKVTVEIAQALRADTAAELRPAVAKQWPVPTPELRRGQEALHALPAESETVVGENRLILEDESGAKKQFVWHDPPGTPTLQQASAVLRQLAHANYAEALFLLQNGSILRTRGQLEPAVLAFEAGINALGSDYTRPEMIDDTSSKLILAQHNHRLGKTAEAGGLFERVLGSRTQAYEHNVLAQVDR